MEILLALESRDRVRLLLDRFLVRGKGPRLLLIPQKLLEAGLLGGDLLFAVFFHVGRQQHHRSHRDVLPLDLRQLVTPAESIQRLRDGLPLFGCHHMDCFSQQSGIPRQDLLEHLRPEALALLDRKKAIPLGHPESLLLLSTEHPRQRGVQQESEHEELHGFSSGCAGLETAVRLSTAPGAAFSIASNSRSVPTKLGETNL